MSNDNDFFALFRSRWKLATEAEADQRQAELADLEFEAGEHWSAKIKAERAAASQPCLVIDLLSGPIKRVTNMQRTARPGIKIAPVGKGADIEQAERWQGVIRRVERLSGAHRVYTWAGQHQVKMGRGFWVVRNEETGDDGEQDIRLEEVENQHTIYVDPTTKKLDGSDKRWAIRFQDLTHEEYIDRFGESRLAGSLGQAFAGIGDSPPEWITSKHARIAEYYYLEETKRTRLILSNGQRVWEDELPTRAGREKGKFAKLPILPDGVTVQRRVVTKKKTVHWCLLNGAGEKLESTTIPGEYIPVVMVYGERRMIDGKRDFRGMVRMAKDASRMEDFCESSLMEAISQAKSAPWLAEEGQLEEHMPAWTALTPPKVYLYKKVDIQGHPVERPSRISSDVDVGALTLAAQRMQQHIRNGLGNADVFQEESKTEQSGRAILARKQAQELETSDYMENLGDGIVLTAKIVMSMAREVYDTPRLLRITGEDEKEQEIITMAGQGQRPQAQQMARQGQGKSDIAGMLDVSLGEYDITVSAGRSYATAQQEAREVMEALPPEIMAQGADIYVGSIDAPGMQELAKRLKKANPLAQDEDQPVPPKIQQRLVQLDQFAQMATDQITELKDQIANKQDELASKERIALAEIEAKVQIVAAQEHTKLQLAELSYKQAQMQGEIDSREAHLARVQGQAHEVGMAGMGAAQDEDSAARAHGQAMELGEQGHRQTLEAIQAQPPPNGAGA